jgi:hypothetical protein
MTPYLDLNGSFIIQTKKARLARSEREYSKEKSKCESSNR